MLQTIKTKDRTMKFLQIMRPLHWTKNIFVFAALIFGRKLDVPLAVGRVIGGFFFFSLAASTVYIFNDIIDRKSDRLHPEKCKRPIAAGDVTVGSAVVMSVLCAAAAVVGSFMLAGIPHMEEGYARLIVTAIISGKIKNVRIEY